MPFPGSLSTVPDEKTNYQKENYWSKYAIKTTLRREIVVVGATLKRRSSVGRSFRSRRSESMYEGGPLVGPFVDRSVSR